MTNEVTKGKSYAGNPRTRFGSIVCAGAMALFAFLAQAGTVAYWPMTMNPATGGTDRRIADVAGNGCDLNVQLTDVQAANTDEIPFAHPPNGPAEITISSCAEILDGTKLEATAFMRGTGDQTKTTTDPAILALGLRHDFTLEGYMYVKSLQHGIGKGTIFVFSGVNGKGDWMCSLLEPTANSNTRQVKIQVRGGGAAPGNGGVLATIDDADILGGWHHYAIVFKFNEADGKSRWSFYLDGVNRGSQLMTNHAENENVQHDRLILGGAKSSGLTVMDAKFAFWRISNEALSSNSMLCHRTFETLAAYWPMNVYASASDKIVPDVVDERNTLAVRDPTKGGVSWTDNDIGWMTPPNPDAELTAAGVVCPSKMKVVSSYNTIKIDNQYKPVFATASDAPVIEATKLTKGFTIEGFLRFAELPDSSSASQMFAYNTLGEVGGWCWRIYGPGADGNLSMTVAYALQGSRPEVAICNQIRAEELLNVWNHYALSFVPDNGVGKTEWRFYLNGRLRGRYTAMPTYSDYSFSGPKFFLSGAAGSGTSSLRGDMTCWRVSKTALKPSAFLCGGIPSIPADALVWKGSSSSGEWSTGVVANWEANGERVAWTDAKDAYFDDFFVQSDIAVVGEVNPASIAALDDLDMKITFNADGTSAIGAGCTNVVKRGSGTVEFSYGGSKAAQLLKGSCPIEVYEGCLKVTAANSNGGLGDASRGYEVKVYENAKLWINGRNAIGNATPDVANDSVFTVYTNGTFDMSCNDFNLQALGTLDLLGGDFVAPSAGHALGYLMIRNRLTLGLRSDRQPYVFPAVVCNDGKTVIGGVTIGRNTEFRVEDVTGDAASDGIFDCAVLARTRDSWQTAQNPCGFRKTGTGTMEMNGKFLGGSSDQARPSGVIAVEAGELKINIDYRGSSKCAIADGAYLSGTGKVSNVEFAAGAGVRVDATKAECLEIENADFTGTGVIELSGVPAESLANLKVRCAKVAGTVTGVENLSGWKVKVNGTECPDIVAKVSGGFLVARVLRGLFIVVQ